MKKKTIFSLILSITLSLTMVYANGQTENVGEDVTTIKFYGSGSQYNVDMVSQFEAGQSDIKVEIVPVDFSNAEQIIKTGIASGNPVDVSFFWGSAMNSFVQDDMAYDLTPYLMENNKEWYNTFVPKFIDAGKYDGKYFAVSYQPVIETIFYNKDLFKELNIDVPETWDELLEVAAIIKDNGKYAIGTWNGMQHQMLPWTYQIWANNGVLEEATAGKLPFAGPNETPGLRENLEMILELYNKGYWYPGEGALTSTQDQVVAAWYQGKIAMQFDANSDAGKYESEAPFEVGAMRIPLIKEGGIYGVNVVTNALFIPANAKYPEEGIEFMKFYTSPAGQAITNATGRPPSTIEMQEKVDNPLVNSILATTRIENSVGYTHIQNLSSEFSSYVTDMVSIVCSGETIDSVLENLETLRLEALND